MSLTIHQTFVPADDPDESLAFYRDCAFRDPAGSLVRIYRLP